MHKGGKDFVLGAMIGSTLGALAAAMFTTKQGHKVQKELMDKYHEFDHAVRKFIHTEKKELQKAVKKAKTKVKKAVKRKRVSH